MKLISFEKLEHTIYEMGDFSNRSLESIINGFHFNLQFPTGTFDKLKSEHGSSSKLSNLINRVEAD